jgi:hypothetical protein
MKEIKGQSTEDCREFWQCYAERLAHINAFEKRFPDFWLAESEVAEGERVASRGKSLRTLKCCSDRGAPVHLLERAINCIESDSHVG